MSDDVLSVTRTLQAYQCDRYQNMRPVTLMNELQGMGDAHAAMLGVGYDYCLSHNIAWVVTHYLVDIIEAPHEGDEITITTWPSCQDALRATRDFEIRAADGRLLVRATSQWVLIDMTRRRPLKLADNLPTWTSSTHRAWARAFEKFPDFDAETTHEFKCRFDDIDVNQHINNAVYAVWATESVGFEFRNTHRLRGIELNYKKEISPTTPSVCVDVAMDGMVSHHRIRTDAAEHAIITCFWEPLADSK